MATKTINLDNYYCDYDPDKYYDQVLIRDGYTTQGREINNIQQQVDHRITSVASALFADGDIVEGAQIIVDKDTGAITAQAGKIYLNGMVRNVPERQFHISTGGVVTVGVYLQERIITELEDPALYNPAVGSRGEGEPGACRLQVIPAWGYAGDGGTGEFFPVHIVEDGAILAKEAPPVMDSFNQAIARYDRDSTDGGTYIASGLTVRSAGKNDAGEQVYTVAEGRARVYGTGIEQHTSHRLRYAATPDLRLIDTEIHTAESDPQRITVAHPPIQSITAVKITARRQTSVVHGAYPGVSDTLPDTAVVSILECRQGDTVFVQGTDYKRTGDTVDWSLSGAEPATGSTYSVTYTYMVSATPQDPDYDGFTVEGAVAGSSIIVTYSQALPRKDRLCLTQDGAYVWYRGVASEQNPRSPEIPAGVLPLATVFQSWRDDVDVDNDGSVSVSFSFLAALTKRVDYALAEVARTRLETDISTREAGARAGIFVDPLTDDTNRDQGIEQTAAVFDGVMTLGAGVTTHRLENPKNTPAFPAFTPTPIISQLFRTGEMKVNPYMAFGTLPAALTLTPAIDQWTETDTVWTSAVTKVVTYRSLNSWDDADLSTNTEVVSSTVSDLEYLRPIDVQFDIADFDAGEVLDAVIFDGITVAHSPSIIAADSAGKASGTFTIPEKVLAGAKTVSIIGKNGSFGGAPFVGQGKLNVQTLRNVRNWATVMGSKVGERFSTISLQIVDPLAQTFVLDSAAQICGVDLWFVAKSTDVLVQIREVQTGLPTSVILAEARIKPEDIVVTGGGHTRILFDSPVPLQAGIEYCFVVLCNDSETAVSVAEGGKYDDYRQEWVASQPYTVGVLLSSSNASTWTAHQNLDMTFRLLACAFVPGTHVVTMGTAQLTNATDLVLHALDETPTSDALVQYQIILPGSETLTVASGQAVRLPSPTTGMVSVMARLTGTQKSAPLLWPDALLLAGELLETGDYYSRSITALDAIKATLIYDAIIPSGASVTPEIQIDSGEWEALPLAGTVIQGDQVVEYTHTKPLNNAALAKVRFTLSGNTSSRPFVGNVRFMATK